ncbi:hypothetical protein LCGC14_1241100, partial [marine sediment metagenome]
DRGCAVIHPSHGVQIFVVTKHKDFRNRHDGLAALVQLNFKFVYRHINNFGRIIRKEK